jgi:hypothetical protein
VRALGRWFLNCWLRRVGFWGFQIQLAKVDAAGAVISDPFLLETKWDYEGFVRPKAGVDTDGSW